MEHLNDILFHKSGPSIELYCNSDGTRGNAIAALCQIFTQLQGATPESCNLKKAAAGVVDTGNFGPQTISKTSICRRN